MYKLVTMLIEGQNESKMLHRMLLLLFNKSTATFCFIVMSQIDFNYLSRNTIRRNKRGITNIHKFLYKT